MLAISFFYATLTILTSLASVGAVMVAASFITNHLFHRNRNERPDQ